MRGQRGTAPPCLSWNEARCRARPRRVFGRPARSATRRRRRQGQAGEKGASVGERGPNVGRAVAARAKARIYDRIALSRQQLAYPK
jgi:hypothetical protein